LPRQRADKDLKSGQVSAEVDETQDPSLQSHVMILMNLDLVLQGIELTFIGQRMTTLKIETGEEIDVPQTGDVIEDLRTDRKADGVLKGLGSHQIALGAPLTDQGNHLSLGFSGLETMKEKGAQGLILTRVLTSKEDSKSLAMILKVVGHIRVADQCRLALRAGGRKRTSQSRRKNAVMTGHAVVTGPRLPQVAGGKVRHRLHLPIRNPSLLRHLSK
jgi:hypothetical protein